MRQIREKLLAILFGRDFNRPVFFTVDEMMLHQGLGIIVGFVVGIIIGFVIGIIL